MPPDAHNAGQQRFSNRAFYTLKSHLIRFSIFLKSNSTMVGISLAAILLTVLTCAHYLLVMQEYTYFGFALDDSWIHLEFARSIFEGRAWQYSPNWPSTGSTSPLWAIVLSPLFLISSEPSFLIIGTYFVSWILYAGSTLLAGLLCKNYAGSPLWAYIGMIGFVLVPRNTWLMLSGMETPLFIFLILLGTYLMEYDGPKYDLALGAIAGFLFLARPEGVVFAILCFPARFLITALKRNLDLKRFGSFLLSALIASLIALLWILYCISITGYPLPDTFYAKTHPPTASEIEAWDGWWIAISYEMPFIIFGLVFGLFLFEKKRPYLWLFGVGLAVLYRLAMPFQALLTNFRYASVIYILLLIVAVGGIGFVIETFHSISTDFRFEVSLSAVSAFVIIIILIPMIQPYTYQADFLGHTTKNINDMQVTIGFWVNENVPANASLGVTDAGAIRFFGNRTIFDLAGLMSPQLNHANYTFLEKLKYLRNQSVEYCVTWTEWFRSVAAYYRIPLLELYRVELTDNVICADDSMSVFFLFWNQTSWA